MKRILLVTHMYSYNSGDLLISESIASSASSRKDWDVERLPFLYYNGMVGSKLLNGLFGIGRVFNALRRNDVTVIAGGNLVIPRTLRFGVSLAVYGLLSRWLKKPLYVAFIGASDRPHWLGSPISRVGLRAAVGIWARDRHSAEVIRDITGRKDTLISPDGAFFCAYQCDSASDYIGKRIAIVPYAHQDLFWNEQLTEIDGDAYESLYHDVVNSLQAAGWEVKIIITSEPDKDMGVRLAKAHGLAAYQPTDGAELVRTICREVDVLVSTRMHGLIAGLLCNKGVIPVGGQHKVIGLLEDMVPGGGQHVLKVDPELATRITCCVEEKRWFVLPTQVRQAYSERLNAVWKTIDDAGTSTAKR